MEIKTSSKFERDCGCKNDNKVQMEKICCKKITKKTDLYALTNKSDDAVSTIRDNRILFFKTWLPTEGPSPLHW